MAKEAPVKHFFIPTSNSAKSRISAINACFQARIAYELVGAPGNGKSALIYAVASDMGYEVETVIGRHMHPVEAAGLPIVVHTDPENPVTVKALPDWFRRAQKLKKLVLFFDEFKNTPASTQAALLVFIQSRILGGHKLPDETVIIMASNPLESSADGHPLTQPMANRIIHGSLYEPDPEDWFEGMACHWNIPNPSFRLIEERALITAFLHSESNVDLLDKGPKDAEQAGQAHPTRRSWDNLTKVLSFTEPGDAATRDELFQGCVGEEAFLSFASWNADMNLPLSRDILDNPNSFDWANESSDRIYALLSIIASVAGVDDAEQLAQVFIVAGQSGTRQDIGAGMVTSIIPTLISGLGSDRAREYLDQIKDIYMPVLAGSGISGGAR